MMMVCLSVLPEGVYLLCTGGGGCPIVNLCGAFGALACTFLGDVFGRRKAIFCATCTQVIGDTSFSFAQFIFSRVFIVDGAGGIVTTVSVWPSKLSKASKRGEHVAAFGMFCGLGLSYALFVDLGMSNKTALKAAVVFIFLCYWAYSVGSLIFPFLYASEIAPAKQRAAICGVSTAVSWLFNWLIVEITPPAFTNIGYRYFIVYTVICFSYLPIISFFFPETKGRDLEESDGIFAAPRAYSTQFTWAKTTPKQYLSDFMQQIDERKGNINESESPSEENQNKEMTGSSEGTSHVRGKAGDASFEEVERA